jgi:purine catabolism regulator
MASTSIPRATSATLSVADALALEEVSRWHPEVMCGHDNLGRPVRWAHVAEAVDIGAMLSGDELLMTTGVLLRGDEPAQRRYIEQLIAADISALVLGLGRAFHEVPPVMLHAARAAGLPMIVVRRPIPFVQMSEAIQRCLLDERASSAVVSEDLRNRILPIVMHRTSLQELTDALAATCRGRSSRPAESESTTCSATGPGSAASRRRPATPRRSSGIRPARCRRR